MQLYESLRQYPKQFLSAAVLLGLANGPSDEGPEPLSYFWVIEPVCTTTGIATFAQYMNGRLRIRMPNTAAGVTSKLYGSLPAESARYCPNFVCIHGRCITLQFQMPWMSFRFRAWMLPSGKLMQTSFVELHGRPRQRYS